MIISCTKKFVVLAPWKTASSTLHARFAEFNESPYSRFYDFQPALNRVAHQHLTCAEFAAFPESRHHFLVASFVRNPYDRAYSGFIQLQRDIREQPAAEYPAPWIRELVMKQLADNQAQLQRADFDFDRWMLSVTEDQVLDVGRNTSFPLHPGHYWTHLEGRPYASFIGRVERFEEDIDKLCKLVDIALPHRENDNVTGVLQAASGISRYAPRMARKSIDRINALFKSDFDLFGFDMSK